MAEKNRILVLDDEPEVAEILGVLLEEDFICETFTDASLAFKALEKRNFTVIITDLEMPQFSGLQFIKQVLLFDPKKVILISTGHDVSHPKVREALQAGARGVVNKPFLDPESLVGSIRAALK